jgi:MFS family permease
VFILAGLTLLGAASGAYAFVSNYYLVVLLRALQGLGAALAIPATVALVNELGSGTERGGNFGVFNTFRLIGFGFGPLVAGLVVEYGPYRVGGQAVSGFDAAFGVAVAGAAVSFLLVWALVSDPEGLAASAGEDLSLSPWGGEGRLLDPVFALGVATVCMGLTISLFATLEGRINDRLAQDSVLFGAQFGAVVIANVLFQVPIGRASDAYGRRPFVVAGFCLLAPATLAQGLVVSSEAMILARLLQGVAVAAVFAPSLAIAGDLARTGRSGTTLSILTMGFGLGTALGPLVSGLLVRFGFVVPFAIGAALGVVGLALVYTQVSETLPEERRRTIPLVG